MTPKEKAKELVEVFGKLAPKVVDEIYKLNNLDVGIYDEGINMEMYYSYWEEVKQEINKL